MEFCQDPDRGSESHFVDGPVKRPVHTEGPYGNNGMGFGEAAVSSEFDRIRCTTYLLPNEVWSEEARASGLTSRAV